MSTSGDSYAKAEFRSVLVKSGLGYVGISRLLTTPLLRRQPESRAERKGNMGAYCGAAVPGYWEVVRVLKEAMEMIVNFEEVRMYGRKSVKCAGGCGRRLRRSRKFSQTINPFNKNPDGTVKNRNDIYNELSVWVREWEKAPEECIHCSNPF